MKFWNKQLAGTLFLKNNNIYVRAEIIFDMNLNFFFFFGGGGGNYQLPPVAMRQRQNVGHRYESSAKCFEE